MKEYIVETNGFTKNGRFIVADRVKIIKKGELTRCKDCVYFTPEKSGEHWNVCRFYDAPKTADGFCNDAEPKETENDKTEMEDI